MYDPDQVCPLLDNTNMDIRFIGLEALLAPFQQFTSSQRAAMFASHTVQALPLHEAEHPKIFTGYESIFGKYDFNPTKRNQDIYILDVVPKYPINRGIHPIKENPSYTVIYRGLNDSKVNYFILEKYGKGTDGYGYVQKWINTNLLTKGNYINKDVKFIKSPCNIEENMYGMGVNANVAFMTLPEVNNDAFLISESLAKKMTTTSVNTIDLKINPNQIPLNLYGDISEYKFLPDIGERVRNDGILCGFRTPTDSTFISDMMESELSVPHPCHDNLYYCPSGSIIADIDFYVNYKKKIKTNKELFTQVDKYRIANINYWQRVLSIYEECKNKKYELSPAFNTLVTRCMAMLISNGVQIKELPKRTSMDLIKKKDPIEFIYIKLTYVYDRKVNLAFKLTSRDGAKGVISDIRPDDQMPIDDYGFKADLVIDPHAVVNRMNPGQMFEQYINRVSEIIRKNVEIMVYENRLREAYDYVLEYIELINSNYANMIVKPNTENNYHAFLLDIIKDGIYLFIPPFLKHMSPDFIITLYEKYGVENTPVTFYAKGKDGEMIKSRSKCNVCIGSKYIYLLYKLPHVKSPGVSYINQFKVPVKASAHNKLMFPIGQTPLRLGEDETRIMTMCSDAEYVVRLMGVHANSFEAVKCMISHLLREEYPSKLTSIPMSTDKIIATNNVISVAKHMMATMGVSMDNITCEAFDEAKFIADLQSPYTGEF